MSKTKGDHKKGGNKKGKSAKFTKKEYNAPLKYKSEVHKAKNKKVKLTYHVGLADATQFFNLPVAGSTEEKKVSIEIESFDDGTEEQFLMFKRNLEQTIQDNELEPVDDGHGAKHLYTLVQKALSGNVLDKWNDISSARATKSYVNFQVDLWKLTDKQIDDDLVRQQKRYLENTKKPRKMTSKEWLNRIKVINNYLPRMKNGQPKYSDEELVEKIVQDNIPDSWQEKFELLDGPKATNLRTVQLTLQKIERCENVENSKKVEKSDGKNKKKSGDSSGGQQRSNPCRKEGHNHDWKDCPDNWKNKKKNQEKSSGKNQENNLILAASKGFFDSTSEEESSDDESVVSQESFCINLTNLAKETDSKSGEILISIVRGAVRKNYTCLLDTGTSQSLLSEKLADEKAVVKSKKKTCWETKGGKFSTSKRVIVKDCKLPQFTSHRKFDGLFHLFLKRRKTIGTMRLSVGIF